jgi:hypothetical protein
MIRVLFGILLLALSIQDLMDSSVNSLFPWIMLGWAAFVGSYFFFYESKLRLPMVLMGLLGSMVLMGVFIMYENIYIILMEFLFGFFAGTALGSGLRGLLMRSMPNSPLWVGVSHILLGIGCLLLSAARIMEYFTNHGTHIDYNAQYFMDVVLAAVALCSVMGFLLSYGLKFSIRWTVVLILGCVGLFGVMQQYGEGILALITIFFGFLCGYTLGRGTRDVSQYFDALDQGKDNA